MFNKGTRGLFNKKSYCNKAPPTTLSNTELEQMNDSSAYQEATAAKVEESKKFFEEELQKVLEKQRKLEMDLALKEKQLKDAENVKRQAIEEEEKKRKPIPMDIESMPSDHILLPPTIEKSTPHKPIVHQISTPLEPSKKVYYTQIVKN